MNVTKNDIKPMTCEEINEMLDSEKETTFNEENNKKIVINDIHDDFDNERSRIRKIEAKNFTKVELLKWNKNPETIKIDEDGDITCESWGDYCIKGKENIVETTELINRYIDECHKMKDFRDFSFIEIIEKPKPIEEPSDDMYADFMCDVNSDIERPKIPENILADFLD